MQVSKYLYPMHIFLKKNLKNVCRKMMHYEQRKEDEDDIKFIGKKNAGQKTMEEHL